MNSIIKTDQQIDVYQLIHAMVTQIFPVAPFDHRHQISMKCRAWAQEPFYDGLGKVDDLEEEQHFTVFNEAFVNSYFKPVYQQIAAWSRLRIGRVRLMRIPPRTTYSIHADGNVRYHIVIQTNAGAYHWTVGEEPFHIPMDGFVYSIAANVPHTAFNTGSSDRIHLVFCTY